MFEFPKRKKTPREHAEEITENKEKPHHVGRKTNAVLQQEFMSLINTKEAFRDDEWLKKYRALEKTVFIKENGNLILSSFKSKYGHLGRIPPAPKKE